MILALRRGAEFRAAPGPDTHKVLVPIYGSAFDTLYEVARALGYESSDHYNYACINRPDEVRERLAAL